MGRAEVYERLLSEERAAHQETRGYLDRALAAALHWQMQATQTDPGPLPPSVLEWSIAQAGAGRVLEWSIVDAGAGGGGGTSTAHAETTELLLQTLGPLARLGELLVLDDETVSPQVVGELVALARNRLARLERRLKLRGGEEAGGVVPASPPPHG
jgi:hypothetical protein